MPMLETVNQQHKITVLHMDRIKYPVSGWTISFDTRAMNRK